MSMVKRELEAIQERHINQKYKYAVYPEQARLDIKNLLTEIDRLQAERDAAVKDLSKATISRPKTCSHYGECYQKCYDAMRVMRCVTCKDWQWRGMEGIDENV